MGRTGGGSLNPARPFSAIVKEQEANYLKNAWKYLNERKNPEEQDGKVRTVRFITAWRYSSYQVNTPECNEWDEDYELLGVVDMSKLPLLPIKDTAGG